MKKIFLIGAAALGMFFMTTSCMDNTEPAGIEEMRMAKSELLRAQAAYETARAAVEQANAAIQQAKAEWQTLQNQLVEITVQEEQLDLELRQAEQEYKIALLEYQYQAEIAADSADIMYYQSKIAWYEWEVMRCEMEQDSISLSRERMIERHNAWLLQLQTATAQAQYNYETALRDIAALKTGLTEKESTKLEEYIDKIEGTNGTDGLRQELRQAETALIDAQRNLLRLQMSLNADSLYLENVYAAQVDAQNVVLKFAEEALAEAPDLTSSDSWVAQKVAAEEEMENIEKTIDDLQRDAEEMKGEKAPFEAKVQELNKEKEILKTQIEEVYAQLGFDYNDGNPFQSGTPESKLDERAVFTLTIPENILQVVAPIINNNIKATDKTNSPEPADNDVVIISGIEEVDGKYVLENGESFSWETSYKKANEIFDGTNNNKGLIAALDELHLATAEIADVQLKINDATIALNDPVTGYKSQYDKYLAIFDEGLADFNEYAEEYGITYNSEDKFVLNSVNMAQAAKDALADIHELLSGATAPTQAQIEPLINTIRTEQETRFALVGRAVADYEKLTYANYSAATPVITITDLENAVDDIDNNPVISGSGSGSGLNYIPGTLEMDTDVSKWSAAARWAIASDKIYGQSYVRQTLTNDYVGYGEAFIVEFEDEAVSIKSLLDDDDNNNNLKQWLIKLGYNSVEVFTETLFYRNIAQPILIAGLQSLVSDNTLYANLVQEVETYDLAIDALVKENTGAAAELYAQLRDLYDQLDAKDDAIEVAQKSIDSVDFEISKICSADLFNVTFGNSTINVPADDYSQVGVEVRKWNILFEKVSSLNSLLDNEYVSIRREGTTYTYYLSNMICNYRYWDDATQQSVSGSFKFTLEELQAAWTESLQTRVELEQRNLINLQTNLEMLRASEDPYHYAIQQAEKAVEDAQAAYDNKLAEFNLWNNMLSDLLKILAGNEEELPEENPEA